MKALTFLFILLASACAADGTAYPPPIESGPAPMVYLVRHAEKQTGENPSLTQTGKVRAKHLADIMMRKGVTHIFSSKYNRTLETAAPTARRAGLEVQIYNPRNLSAFAEKLQSIEGVLLVVGHSNTTPQLAALLGADPGTKIVEKTEFDRLYEIDLQSSPPTSKITRYGAE